MYSDCESYCPKCTKKIREQALSKYGKVSADEYGTIIRNLEKEISQFGRTLSVDIGSKIDDRGKLMITYSCKCSRCRFNREITFFQDIFERIGGWSSKNVSQLISSRAFLDKLVGDDLIGVSCSTKVPTIIVKIDDMLSLLQFDNDASLEAWKARISFLHPDVIYSTEVLE
jgi:hypothetical protein